MMKLIIKLPEMAKRKAHREGRSITKFIVAKETMINYNTISAYWDNEIQRVDLGIMAKLCDYLDCHITDLLVEVEDEEKIKIPA